MTRTDKCWIIEEKNNVLESTATNQKIVENEVMNESELFPLVNH